MQRRPKTNRPKEYKNIVKDVAIGALKMGWKPRDVKTLIHMQFQASVADSTLRKWRSESVPRTPAWENFVARLKEAKKQGKVTPEFDFAMKQVGADKDVQINDFVAVNLATRLTEEIPEMSLIEALALASVQRDLRVLEARLNYTYDLVSPWELLIDIWRNYSNIKKTHKHLDKDVLMSMGILAAAEKFAKPGALDAAIRIWIEEHKK